MKKAGETSYKHRVKLIIVNHFISDDYFCYHLIIFMPSKNLKTKP